MRVLHLSTNDSRGGAARAAYRLHAALVLQGVDSKMLVQYKFGSDPRVIGVESWLGHRFNDIYTRFDGLPLLFSTAPRNTFFSPAILPDLICRNTSKVGPDLVHLHWIANGFMRIETLPKLTGPVVWTLHDMWPFTGGCHYSSCCTKYTESCGKCPALRSSSETDLSRSIWNRKKSSWKNVRLTLITPSNWLAKCAAQSSLFAGRDIKVIPNPIDTEVFRGADESKNQVRKSFGLSTDHKLILFGAMDATADARKGFVYLNKSLQLLAKAGWGDRAEVVVFGAEEPLNPPDFGMKATYISNLNDDRMIARLYYAADVFVAPSLQDNLPNTVMESLACGTPVVAFNIGGMPDMIEHERTGWLSPPFDLEDFAQGISFVLTDRDRDVSMSRLSRLKVEKEYSEEVVAAKVASLYLKLI